MHNFVNLSHIYPLTMNPTNKGDEDNFYYLLSASGGTYYTESECGDSIQLSCLIAIQRLVPFITLQILLGMNSEQICEMLTKVQATQGRMLQA